MSTAPSDKGPIYGTIVVMIILLGGAIYALTGHQLSATIQQDEVYIPQAATSTQGAQ